MKARFIFVACLFSAPVHAIEKDLVELVTISGVAIGKGVACKLSGPKVIEATKIVFAHINLRAKTSKDNAALTNTLDKSIKLGETYIRENGNGHCPTIDKTLDVIIKQSK